MRKHDSDGIALWTRQFGTAFPDPHEQLFDHHAEGTEASDMMKKGVLFLE